MLSRALPRARPSRSLVIVAVVLGHAVVFYVLGLLAQQPLFGRTPLGAVPSQETTRLLVSLLPFVAQPVPALPASARQASAQATRQPDSPVAQTQAPMVSSPVALSATPFATSSVASAPAPVLSDSGNRLDAATLQQTLQDADRGSVRDVFKRAGRLHEIEPERPDKLAKAIAGAGRKGLRELGEAKIARDDACRQELGLNGVGERSPSNDRDTFMPSYIGAGRVCKTSR